jgi:hypothetical protein
MQDTISYENCKGHCNMKQIYRSFKLVLRLWMFLPLKIWLKKGINNSQGGVIPMSESVNEKFSKVG